MDAKRNRNKMLADTNESGYVWTGPKFANADNHTFQYFDYKYFIP